ncbi:MAG: hypothetical protein HF976_03290 [ANME-2 cluster archaeon]|nr:hypothetical protein [ANME-2 cluster archaeon]MBC2700427.1 hypothetical protein [ANME-2 cluster archaeon]MBC2706491.1 hypothetical protein [ANME-2 cluster archaeon]MBC2747980.1 hypothetical protein [ANME-2 cluster archaeon]
MKIRTIIGVLLVLALVLGSTGSTFAANDANEDGMPDRDRIQWTDTDDDSILDSPPKDGLCRDDVSFLGDKERNRDCDEDCVPEGSGPHYGPK